MDIQHISTKRFNHTVLWAVLLSSLVIGVVATLGRAMANVRAALTDKPDIAIYMLLKEQGVRNAMLLRAESETERDYLVETKSGPTVVKLRKGEEEWYVHAMDRMRP